MSTAVSELRRELRWLFERHAKGDIPEKMFQRQLAEKSVALSRAVVAAALSPGEPLLAEHHLIHSHIKLTQSLLEEPEQATASFFATDRALYRVRGKLLPGRAVSCDEADSTTVEALRYAEIERLAMRCERRWGEVSTGLVIMLVALALRNLLAVTGPLLVLLGVVGTLHGLLMPTRWLEIVPREADVRPPWEFHAIRKRSARSVVTLLRRALGAPDSRVSP